MHYLNLTCRVKVNIEISHNFQFRKANKEMSENGSEQLEKKHFFSKRESK